MSHLYSPHQRTFYTTAEGLGPGSQTLTSTEWNLLAIFSRSLFSWDGSKVVPENNRDGEFDPDILAAVRGTIHQSLAGSRVGDLVTKLDPAEFLTVLSGPRTTIGHLEAIKFWGNQQVALRVVEARVLTWLSVQPRKTSGKLVSLRALTPEQQMFIDKVNPWMNGEIVLS